MMTLVRSILVLPVLITFGGCASLSFSEPAETLDAPKKSEAIQSAQALAHPDDPSIASLEALFAEKTSPLWTKEIADRCAEPLAALNDRTESRGELERGLIELVAANPAFFHWCFYGKLLDLERALATESFVLERQAIVVRAFKQLAPLSKAFLTVTLDSRYYRYSVRRYQELAARVFFRKVEALPEVTERLLEQAAASAREANRDPNGDPSARPDSVLRKRGVAGVPAVVERESPSPPFAGSSLGTSTPESVPPAAITIPRDDPWKELDRYPASEPR